MRYHTDNNLQLRYFNQKTPQLLSRAAFALAADFGCEDGGGVSCRGQYFLGIAA